VSTCRRQFEPHSVVAVLQPDAERRLQQQRTELFRVTLWKIQTIASVVSNNKHLAVLIFTFVHQVAAQLHLPVRYNSFKLDAFTLIWISVHFGPVRYDTVYLTCSRPKKLMDSHTE